MDKNIGKRLDGRYEILELIGVGGMANVYKAHDVTEDRMVAVKILREEYHTNEDFLRRFKNESKAIAILNHPNIVKVYDVIFTPQTQSIVMEYIDGISLKEYIEQQGILKWREAVYFTIQILRGLQHAHNRGIVHRDIKPQNIMLLYDGTIKITDFGIARFARNQEKTLTDHAIGSVHYISPEQARGDSTDEQSDLYSVGVMLFEMLTGKLPFVADSPVSVAIKQIQSIPKRPREINPNIPEGLECITMRAMQKSVEKRYHSAAEMLHDIDEFKRNPSINFEYKYLTLEEEPQEISHAMKSQNRSSKAVRRRNPLTGGQDRPSSRAPKKREPKRQNEAGVEHRTPVLPILGGVAGAFLLVSTLFILWMFLTNNPFEVVAQVKLPNFVGQSLTTVKEKYGNRFQFEVEQAFSNETERNLVMEQIPKAGTRKVREGTTIKLKVSAGEQTLVMDDYAGKEASEVVAALKGKGFQVTQSNINHPTVSKGQVIKTDPPKGSDVTPDTPVTVYVSSGKAKMMITVPNLSGLTQEEAKQQLRLMGLRLGNVIPVYEAPDTENTPASGTVVGQEPQAEGEGESARMVEEGASISIMVYQGGEGGKVKMTIGIDLPVALDRNVEMSAKIGGSTVLTQTLNPKTTPKWNINFESSNATEEVDVLLDGELYCQIEMDFTKRQFRKVADYSADFA